VSGSVAFSGAPSLRGGGACPFSFLFGGGCRAVAARQAHGRHRDDLTRHRRRSMTATICQGVKERGYNNGPAIRTKDDIPNQFPKVEHHGTKGAKVW